MLLLLREASRDTAALAEIALAELRELAAEDLVVLQLLNAFATGATTKADVMLLTGMSDQTYHAARIRLDRLVARLLLGSAPFCSVVKWRRERFEFDIGLLLPGCVPGV